MQHKRPHHAVELITYDAGQSVHVWLTLLGRRLQRAPPTCGSHVAAARPQAPPPAPVMPPCIQCWQTSHDENTDGLCIYRSWLLPKDSAGTIVRETAKGVQGQVFVRFQRQQLLQHSAYLRGRRAAGAGCAAGLGAAAAASAVAASGAAASVTPGPPFSLAAGSSAAAEAVAGCAEGPLQAVPSCIWHQGNQYARPG